MPGPGPSGHMDSKVEQRVHRVVLEGGEKRKEQKLITWLQ